MTSIIAVSQKITGTDVYAPHEISQGRITGFFNSANALCLYLIPITIILLSKILFLIKRKQSDQTKSERKKTFVLMIFLVLFLSVIYMTESSGGMLGAIFALGAVFVLHLVKVKISLSPNTIKRIILLCVGLYFVSQIFFFTVISKFTPHLSERPLVRVFDNTVIVRLCLFEGTWKMLQDHRILGTGLSNFPITYYSYVTCDPELLQYPHNLILNFWSELGLLGLLSFGMLIIIYLKNLFSKHNGMNFWQIGLLGILIYYLIHGLVDVPYFKNDLSLMWWIFLGLSFVVMIPQRLDRK
ncbi:hypothetical protein A2011_03655 [candidate division CPR3 bacterium GWE2_35_7]|nr:MAG: hypothetical protein UR87_C0028G0002 [candidate division CPR3 bacterium GW2011_GWE2_35_7]OGB80202.1 MAG: hypothetical protein A2011_03655 [candidate division CPR3 bacterium GWE2_35_7]